MGQIQQQTPQQGANILLETALKPAMLVPETLLPLLQLLFAWPLLLTPAPGASPYASQGDSGVDSRCFSLYCAHVQEEADILLQAGTLVLHLQSVERSSSWQQYAQDDLGERHVDGH